MYQWHPVSFGLSSHERVDAARPFQNISGVEAAKLDAVLAKNDPGRTFIWSGFE